MHRFFIGKKQEDESLLWLSPEESRHAVKVLRIKKGESVLAFDSSGNEYESKVHEMGPDGRLQVEVLKLHKRAVSNSVCIHIAQGFLQKQKMDWIVEKACEIGVSSLVPLKSEFSMVNPKGDSLDRIQNRWNRIIQSAAKQSGNVNLLQISEPMDFKSAVEKSKESQFRFLFHPHKVELNLKQAVEEISGDVFLFIGPEGGFSEKEVDFSKMSGIRTIGLGENILRAETASVVLAGIFKLMCSPLRRNRKDLS